MAKRERSRLERSWRRWKFPFDHKKFRAQSNCVRSLISTAKSNFLTNLVTESSSSPRTFWKTLNSILHRNPSNSFPDTPDTQSLANSFLQFFSDKIERIRSKFPHPTPMILFFFQSFLLQMYLISIQPQFLLSFWNSVLSNLALLSLIRYHGFFSISEGIFPAPFKQAIVHSLLKKPSLPDDYLNNFRPISNLIFISKILEKVVASRIQSHRIVSLSYLSRISLVSLASLVSLSYRISLVSSLTVSYLSLTPYLIIPICLSHVPFHWNYTHQYSQWPHLSDGSKWGHFFFSSSFICCLWYCRSFHPSSSSSTLVWFSWYNFSWLVFILSYITFSGSIHPKFHFIFFKSVLWCTSRFRPSLAYFFSLFIQLLLALSSPGAQSNTTSMLMTPSNTFFSLLRIQLFHFKYFLILFLTYSPGRTQTDCSSIHPKLNFYSLVQNNNGSNFLNSELYLSATISSHSSLCSWSWLHLRFWHVIQHRSNQLLV